MAADPFGDRVPDDIGAELERAAQIRRCEGVVDKERNAGAVRDVRDLRNVEHFEARIADGLADEEPGALPDRGAEAIEIARLDERGVDAEARQRVGQEIDAAAIERGRRDDVVAAIE